MIETIDNRVKLLGSMAGLKSDEINTNLSNISIKMEKATIALASVLIGVEDLDLVTCYLCGICPKIVSSGKCNYIWQLI